jgi:hypothetical protein
VDININITKEAFTNIKNVLKNIGAVLKNETIRKQITNSMR